MTSNDIQTWHEQLAADPHNREAFDALVERYVVARKWQELLKLHENQTVLRDEIPDYWEGLVERLELMSPELEELPDRATVAMEIGKIYEHQIGHIEKAMVYYQKAFKTWPYKTEALDLARDIYARKGNWKLVLRLFQLELQVTKEPDRQAVVHRRMGELYVDEIGDKETGIKLFQRALELNPQDEIAAGLLRTHTHVKPEWEQALEKLSIQLNEEQNPRRKAAIHVKVAELLLDHEPDSPVIETNLNHGMELDPRNADAKRLLATIYRKAGRFEELAAQLVQQADEPTSNKEERRDALIELAEIRRDRLGDEKGAVDAFEKVLDLDPAHPAALRCAEAFYEEKQDWENLVKLYENALRQARRTDGENELLVQLGELLWKKVGDLEGAERQFKRVRLANPKDRKMLEFYRVFLRDEKNWKKLYSTLATLKQIVEDDDDQLEISMEMAQVAHDEMGSPEKAIDVWKSVLKLDPENARARGQLHDLYLKTQKWNALLEFYKEEITHLGDVDTAEVLADKVALHLKMVEIYRDHLRLDVMVINTYNAILQLDAENEDAIDALAQRYEESKRWNDLINVLAKKADVVAERAPKDAIPLLHRIAELWQQRLGNTSQAIPVLERVLEMDENDAEAIGQLNKLYEHRRDWPNLLRVLDLEARTLAGAELARHLTNMAQMARRRLNDVDSAKALHERVLAALENEDGTVAERDLFLETLVELERIYEDQHDQDALIVAFDRRLKVVDSASERIKILTRLAELVREHTDDNERAVGLWRDILALQPENDAALGSLTNFYVENARWNDLEELYKNRGEWQRLFEILDTGAAMADADDARIDLFQRMARIAESQLQDDTKVMLSLESILELQATNVDVARRLLPYYQKAGEATKEVAANQILLENDGGDAFELTREIARLYGKQLSDMGQAFDWEDKAFRMRPQDARLREHVENVARAADRLAELVASFRQVAETVEDEAVRLTLYRSVARTAYNDLDWLDDAVDYFERLLRADSGDAEAVDALLVLYRRLERWEDLLKTMHGKISLLDPEQASADRIELHFQVAELLQGPLARRNEAVESYRAIIALQADNLDAVRGLKVIFQQEENWASMAETTEQELALLQATGGAPVQDLQLQLGNLYEYQLEAPDKAVDWYSRLLGSEPASRGPAVSALEGLLAEATGSPRAVRIAELLEPVHRSDENWSRLGDMLEIRLGAMAAADTDARQSTLWELAGLYENAVEDLDRAYNALERLLGVTPGDEKVWGELERLAGAIDRWEGVAGLYGGLVPSSDRMDAEPWAFALLRRRARIFEQELGRDADARAAYETLLLRDASDGLTIASLEDVYRRLRAFDELVRLLERKAELAEDDEARKSVLYGIADIWEQNLQSPTDAIATFRRVMAVDERDGHATSELERLLAQQGEWQDLVALLGRRIDLAESTDDRHQLKFQLGAVLEDQMDDLDGAVGVYREILLENPAQADALGAFERLSASLEEDGPLPLRQTIDATLEPIYANAENWERLVHILGLTLGYADSDDVKVELDVRIGRLQRDRLGQAEVAFEHFTQAVRRRFADTDLRAELEALADGTDAQDKVVALYEDLLADDTSGDTALKHAVLNRIAELQESSLGDVAAAIDAHRRILELDASDAEALSALERLYAQTSQWSELVEICQRKAEQARGEDRVALLHKVGTLHEGPLDDAEAAIATFRNVLVEKEDDGAALDALERLHTRLEQWRDLTNTLHRKVALAEETGARRDLLLQIAEVCELSLEEPHEAIDIYRRILELVPADSVALDALDRLYSEHEGWLDLAGILERRLAFAADDAARAELLYRLGAVQQDKLDSVPEAIATYGRVLALAADHDATRGALKALLADPINRFAASRVLEPRYRAESDWAALVALLELQLEDTSDRDGQLALLDEIRGLQEDALDDASAAFDAVRRAYGLDPSAADRVAEMERLAGRTGEWDALVGAYERAMPEITDSAELRRVLLTVAATYRDKLQNDDSAESTYRSALDHDAQCLEALEALEELLTRQARWLDLILELERKFQVLSQHGRQDDALAILFQVAQIQDEVQGNAPEAIDVYLRVLDLDPRSFDGIAALKRLYRAEQRWHDLTGLLLREITLVEGDAVVSLRYELAQVYHHELGDLREAVEVYRAVLAAAPDHAEAIAALESMFEAGAERFSVASLLEPIYRRRESWGPLADVLEVCLEDQADEKVRQGTMIQIARIREEKLSDTAAAMAAYRRLLDENPNLLGGWDQLERLASTHNAWAEVAEAYRLALIDAYKLEDDVRLQLLLRRAATLDERMDEIDDAREVYVEVQATNDDNARAIDALDRIYTRQEDWAELVGLYRRCAELATDAGARREYYFKIATLYEEVVQDPDAAIDAYRQIIDLDPENKLAVRSLERLYQAEQQWHELADLYRREASFAEREEDAVALKHQLAMVLAGELDEIPEAIDIFRDILSIRPNHGPSRRALEDLLRELGARGELGTDLRLQIALLLQPLYDDKTEWAKLVDVYEVQLEVIQDHVQRVEVFKKIAYLRETYQDNPHAAFEAYAKAFAEDVRSKELQAHLERLAEGLKAHNELIQIYLDSLGNTGDANRMVELLHRVAELYLNRSHDQESAIGCYRQVLDIDDRDRKAVAKLEQLYSEREMWRDLVDVLERTAELGDDVLERKDTFFRIAELWEKKLGDDDMAIETYRRVLTADEEDIAAIEALERLYHRTEAWDNLISIFAQKVELLDSDAAKIEVYRQMAEIYEVELEQPLDAITTYATIRDLRPADVAAIMALDRLFVREERWTDLLDILEVERDSAGDEDEVSGIEFRMAQLLEHHLYDALRAIEIYRQIVERSSDHTPSIEALEQLMGQPDYRQQASEVLEPLYARKGEWRKLVDALELKLQDLFDPEEQRGLLQQIAQIHEDKLDSRQLAFITWGRAFRAAPEHPAPREQLERLAATMDNYEELVAVYEEKVDELYDYELVKELSMRLGTLHDTQLHDLDGAIARYRRVVEMEEFHAGALSALDDLYQRAERWDALVEILERKLQVVEPDQTTALKFRLAYLLETRFADLDRALAFYKDIIFDTPDHEQTGEALERIALEESHRLEVVDVLEPLYRQGSQWDKLVTLFEMKLELLDSALDRAQILRQIADINDKNQADKPAAFANLARALREDTTDLDGYRQLERMADELDNWSEMVRIYDEIAQIISDDFSRKEVVLKAAAWYRDKLGQPERAEERYRQVLDIEHDNADALDALLALYETLGDYDKLYETTAQKAEILYDVSDRKALYASMADIASSKLEDVGRAIDAWERLRDVDDTDTRALSALGALYEQTDRWSDYVDVHRRRAELSDSGEERLAIWLRIGEVRRVMLEDAEGAVDAYRYAMDLEPESTTAQLALEELYTETERWDNLREVLVQQLTFAETDAQRIALNLKTAVLAEEHFDDVEGAIESYRQILLTSDGHPQSLAELERLYSKTERWFDLQDIYRQQLETATDRAATVRLHVAISNLAAEHLHDPITAKEHLQKVLEFDPNNVDALGVLAVLYEQDGEWEQAMATIDKQIALSPPAASLSKLHFRRGRIQEERFDQLGDAKRSYLQAWEYDKGNTKAGEALKALYRRTEDWPALVNVLTGEAARLPAPAAQVSAFLQIAEIARQQMGDPAAAVQALESAYRVDPENLEVAEPLLQAYIQANQSARAEPILEGIISSLTENRKFKQLFTFQHLRGQMAEAAGDLNKALESYQAAYDIDATYIPNLLSLGKLHYKMEDWERALKIFQTLLLHQMKIKEKDDKLDVYYFLGRVRQVTGDDRRARDMYNRALAIDKNHAPTLKAIEEL